MTVSELRKSLAQCDDDSIVVCMDESGGWDNILSVECGLGSVVIMWGGGSPFSDE